ncbi:MAG: hypothetical protein ABEJ65_11705, partial [bacterium]
SWSCFYEHRREEKALIRALEAAERLEDCFVPELGALVYKMDTGLLKVPVDSLMNLPLLCWADKRADEPSPYKEIIDRVLDFALETFLRGNGGVEHVIYYDPVTFRHLRKGAPQGLVGGCWSRGLAWCHTGLVVAGLYTDRMECLERANRLYEFHRENTDTPIPPYDYASLDRDRANPHPDTSAGAILASGLCTRGILRQESGSFQRAKAIVESLWNQFRRSNDREGIFGGGCFHAPDGVGVNSATVWGDYYGLEALYMLNRRKLPPHLQWLRN